MTELTNEQAAHVVAYAINSGFSFAESKYGTDVCKQALRMAEAALRGMGEPVAEIRNKYGDPEAFAERELHALADIQKFRIGTKLYAPRKGEE